MMLRLKKKNSNRKIVIEFAVASSIKVRNEVRQAKPLVKAMAAADRKGEAESPSDASGL